MRYCVSNTIAINNTLDVLVLYYSGNLLISKLNQEYISINLVGFCVALVGFCVALVLFLFLPAGYKSCVLVAHDWGGLVAWDFGIRYPKLVDKLIVMNAPPYSIFGRILNTNPEQAKKSR